MPQLLDLPFELLLQIFSGIGEETLLRCCTICCRLRYVAQGLYYESVTLDTDDDLLLERQCKFVRTILSRPDLARKVKRLAFDLKGNMEVKNPVDRQVLHASFTGIAQQVPNTRSRSVGYAQLLALLSVRLPSLEYLALYIEKSLPEQLPHFFHQICGKGPPSAMFPSLKMVMLQGYNGYFDLNDALPILFLPTLRTVIASSFLAPHNPASDSPQNSKSDVIHATMLKFTDCAMDARTVQTIIGSCCKLRTLDYEAAYDAKISEFRIPLPHELVQAIEPSHDTLEILTLRHHYENDEMVARSPPNFTTLRQFGELEFLSIQIDLWWRILDKLPGSLVVMHLTLGAEDYDVGQQFPYSILMAKDFWCPNIEIISIDSSTLDESKLIKQHALKHNTGYRVWHENQCGRRHSTIELPVDTGFVVELTSGPGVSTKPVHARTLSSVFDTGVDLKSESQGYDKGVKLPILECRCAEAEDVLFGPFN